MFKQMLRVAEADSAHTDWGGGGRPKPADHRKHTTRTANALLLTKTQSDLCLPPRGFSLRFSWIIICVVGWITQQSTPPPPALVKSVCNFGPFLPFLSPLHKAGVFGCDNKAPVLSQPRLDLKCLWAEANLDDDDDVEELWNSDICLWLCLSHYTVILGGKKWLHLYGRTGKSIKANGLWAVAHIWSNRPGIHSNCMISEDFSAKHLCFFFILRFRILGDISKLADEWSLCVMLLRRPLLLQHTVWYCKRSIKAAFGQECSSTSCICQQKSLLMYFGCCVIDSVNAKWDFWKNYSEKTNNPASWIGIHYVL